MLSFFRRTGAPLRCDAQEQEREPHVAPAPQQAPPRNPNTRLQDVLMQRFAELCASHAPLPDLRETFYQEGLAQFDELRTHPMVAEIGILDENKLLLGTHYVRLRDSGENLHDIGEFIVTMGRAEQGDKKVSFFTCVNITRRVKGYPHPHVGTSGIMCVNERDVILSHIACAEFYLAARIILAALNTLSAQPYSDAAIHNWPLTREGA